uniref:CSON010986 protein n=1 Tax=Culicoides sonorensis TaxID=179676 RepID=A0A336LFV3_CULSO
MDAADVDNGRQQKVRPKITLQIPSYTNRPDLQPSPYFQTAPMTGMPMPGTAGPNSIGPNGFAYNNYMYPQKAGEFMFKQFAGFKDFTMNTAKSGLGFGEKYLFWMYNKVSLWSKSTFTHIFLTIVVLLYSVAGAAIFKAIEGKRKYFLIH